ncbi:MAG: hypothetical protein ACJ768_11840 [Gaiellaceae bacterium]
MRLFGGPTHAVRILGPLTVNGQPLACPEKGCGDTGKAGGHTLTAEGEKGVATITCGANPQHQFRVPDITIVLVKALPRSGRFEHQQGDIKLQGIAARPGKGEKTPTTGGKDRALGQPTAPATPTRPASRGSSGPGLAGVVVAGLQTATAGLGAVSQIAGAAGQGARTLGEVAKAGSNGISLARDGVKAADQAAARRHVTALGERPATPKRAL